MNKNEENMYLLYLVSSINGFSAGIYIALFIDSRYSLTLWRTMILAQKTFDIYMQCKHVENQYTCPASIFHMKLLD